MVGSFHLFYKVDVALAETGASSSPPSSTAMLPPLIIWQAARISRGHGGQPLLPHVEHGGLIRLKRIYNILCSMLVYTPFALSFVTLRDVFMHFLELTY
jgi:hypothetical protein